MNVSPQLRGSCLRASVLLSLITMLAVAASAAPQVVNGAMAGPGNDHSDGKGLLVTPEGWTPVNTDVNRGDRLSVEPSDRPGGGQCLHINTFADDAGVYQSIAPLDKGKTYFVSAWVKRLSGEARIEAYSLAWGPAVMRASDKASVGWVHCIIPLTPIDGGAHLYLVAAERADFLIDDVEIREAQVTVGAPVAQPYDFTDLVTYRVSLSASEAAQQTAPRDVIVQAVDEAAVPSPLSPAQRVKLYPAKPATAEVRLPVAEGDRYFSVRVCDAHDNQVLGGSTLVPQLGTAWDARFPYKDTLYSTTGYRWPMRIFVRRAPEIAMKRLSATATIRDDAGKALRSCVSTLADGALQLPISAVGMPVGDYKIDVAITYKPGRVVYRASRPLRVCPPAANEVVCDATGQVRIGGKPFFPIGMYWVFADPSGWKPGPARKDAELRELRQAGINTLHTYAFEHNNADDTDANALAYLDMAQEFGFKVMLGIRRDWYQGDKLDLAAIEQRVKALKNHPALLCWTLWDEPNFNSAFSTPRLNAMYALINRLDPYHPAMPVFGGPSGAAFHDCTDIFLFDNYPGPGGADQVTQSMKRAAEAMPDKPVWFVGQAFEWPQGRLPSVADMTAYWRNAIAGGAHGYFWYSYGGDGKDWDSVRRTPEHWANVQRVNRELAKAVDPNWKGE
jgi:hypothetical protein